MRINLNDFLSIECDVTSFFPQYSNRENYRQDVLEKVLSFKSDVNLKENENYIFFILFLCCVIFMKNTFYCLGSSLEIVEYKLSKKPHFFIATHDYEFMDMLAVRKETLNWYNLTGHTTIIVVANRWHNRLFDIFLPKIGWCLYVKKGTTKKILRHLTERNVCMFLYRTNINTGIHYILREFCGPTALVKITSNTAQKVLNHNFKSAIDCIKSDYKLSVCPLNNFQCSDEPKSTMLRVKEKLYI